MFLCLSLVILPLQSLVPYYVNAIWILTKQLNSFSFIEYMGQIVRTVKQTQNHIIWHWKEELCSQIFGLFLKLRTSNQ